MPREPGGAAERSVMRKQLNAMPVLKYSLGISLLLVTVAVI